MKQLLILCTPQPHSPLTLQHDLSEFYHLSKCFKKKKIGKSEQNHVRRTGSSRKASLPKTLSCYTHPLTTIVTVLLTILLLDTFLCVAMQSFKRTKKRYREWSEKSQLCEEEETIESSRSVLGEFAILALDEVPIAVLLVDGESRISYGNREAARLLHLESLEEVMLAQTHFIYEEDEKLLVDSILETLTTERQISKQIRLRVEGAPSTGIPHTVKLSPVNHQQKKLACLVIHSQANVLQETLQYHQVRFFPSIQYSKKPNQFQKADRLAPGSWSFFDYDEHREDLMVCTEFKIAIPPETLLNHWGGELGKMKVVAQ